MSRVAMSIQNGPFLFRITRWGAHGHEIAAAIRKRGRIGFLVFLKDGRFRCLASLLRLILGARDAAMIHANEAYKQNPCHRNFLLNAAMHSFTRSTLPAAGLS